MDGFGYLPYGDSWLADKAIEEEEEAITFAMKKMFMDDEPEFAPVRTPRLPLSQRVILLDDNMICHPIFGVKLDDGRLFTWQIDGSVRTLSRAATRRRARGMVEVVMRLTNPTTKLLILVKDTSFRKIAKIVVGECIEGGDVSQVPKIPEEIGKLLAEEIGLVGGLVIMKTLGYLSHDVAK